MGATQSSGAKCPGAVIVAAQHQGKSTFAASSREWSDIDRLLTPGYNDTDIRACQLLGNFMVTSCSTRLKEFKPNVAVVSIPHQQLRLQAPAETIDATIDAAEKLNRAAVKLGIPVFDNFTSATEYLEPLTKKA